MTRDELFERLRDEINDDGSRLEFLARDLMPHIDAYVAAERERLAQEIESQLRPRLDIDDAIGGYNCCGCSTYDQIIDDAIGVVRGES